MSTFCYHCCRFTNSQAKTSSEKRRNAGKTVCFLFFVFFSKK